MSTYTAMMDARREMYEADAAFQSALVDTYGAGNAGDMRYRTNQQTPMVREYGATYQAKAHAWREAVKAHRARV